MITSIFLQLNASNVWILAVEMVQCLSLLQAHCAAKGLSCIKERVNNLLWGCAGKKDALVNKQQFSDEFRDEFYLYEGWAMSAFSPVG